MKKTLKLILTALLALAAMAGAYGAGAFLMQAHKEAVWAVAALTACTAAAVLLILASAILLARFLACVRSQSVRDAQQTVLQKHAEAQTNAEEMLKGFFRSLRLTLLYICFLPLLALAIAFFAGVMQVNVTILNLLSAYMLWGFFIRLFTPKEKPILNDELTREDYPQLFSVLDRVVARLKIPAPRRVVSDPQFNASVFALSNRSYALNLGVQLLYIISEEELEQLLLHEMAHISNKDVLRSRAAGETLSFILGSQGEPSFLNIVTVLFDYPAHHLLYSYTLLEAATSSAKEARADALIRAHGNPQAYASLLAKMGYFELFSLESDRYPETLAFVPEEPRENCRCFMDVFMRAAGERGDFWNTVIRRELPALVDSHPTFHQRWDSLGNCDYTVVFPSYASPTPYQAEVLRALKNVDLRWIDHVTPQYAKLREEYYLKPLSVIEEWELERPLRSMEDMSPILNAYMTLNRYDEALEICDRLLASDQPSMSLAYAKFIKGNELLCRYDPAGIAYLEEAANDNANFTENAINAIILFCRRMGMAEELERFRGQILDKMQEHANTHSHADSLRVGDKLSVEQLPEGRTEEILAFIREVSGEALSEVYLVRKTITESFFTSAFVIRFQDNTDADTVNRAMDRIFDHLDKAPYDWQYSLFLYENDPNTYKTIFRRLPDCKIYARET